MAHEDEKVYQAVGFPADQAKYLADLCDVHRSIQRKKKLREQAVEAAKGALIVALLAFPYIGIYFSP